MMNTTTPPRLSESLEPGIRQFVDAVAGAHAQHQGLDDLPLTTRRTIAEQVRAPWTHGGPDMANVEDLCIQRSGTGANVRVRVLRPTLDGELPALIYLHGGGWTLFSLDTHARLMREYAYRAGVVVIGVDYALSPEEQFPTAIEQIVDVIKWLAMPGSFQGVDNRRLAIGGDSAGANLAFAAALKLRDLNLEKLLSALIVNYGAFDPFQSYRSYEIFGDGRYLLSADEMRMFWKNYLRDTNDSFDPLASPLKADLSHLPPTYFAIAEYDILRDENLHLAECLRNAKASVTQHIYPGTVHSFLEAMSVSAIANKAIDETCNWLRQQLSHINQ